MVIAILGIISTLAVSKIGDIRERAQRQVSLTNQSAIGRALDTYLTLHNGQVNRLDALVDDEVPRGGSNGFDVDSTSVSATGPGFYLGPDDQGAPLPPAIADANSGLTPNLVNNVLIPYSLNQQEVNALANRGFRFVMRHTTYYATAPRDAYSERGDDGAYLPGADKSALWTTPAGSACIPRAVTNGMVVAAVSPFTPEGREIYRDCGQGLLATRETAADYRADRAAVLAEVKATGGPLLAFGLGSEATVVGDPSAGLESAPYATYPLAKFYRQYILLFHVDTSTKSGSLVFAGVLDPCGQTIRMSRLAMKQ